MSEQTTTTSTDVPIDGSDDAPDLLDRERFAEQVAARVVSAGTGDSVVFGLSGAWGAGKTSTLKLIRKTLDKSYPDWIVVDFTPWSANDPNAVAEEFYRTIASKLPKDKGAKARNLLNRAAPALAAGAKVIVTGFVEHYVGEDTLKKAGTAVIDKTADKAGDVQFDDDPFSRRFEKIGKELSDLGVQLLVVVDDIDRLHLDELLAVMKAVRLLGRFRGVHYLLSYDVQTVTDVLTQSNLANGNRRRAEQYLEKVVQYPFELPPLQLFHLRREFHSRLRTLADRAGFTLQQQFSGNLPGDVILEQLSLDTLTLRTLHRLFTQVDMLISLIADTSDDTSRASTEIDLIDAVLITYLRLEYPQLYRSLRAWKPDLTRTRQNSHEEEAAIAEEWRQKIAASVNPDGTNTAACTDAYALLRSMFPQAMPQSDTDYRTTPEHARFQIRSREYFDRYFTFGIPVADIRDAALRAELIELASTGKLPENSLIASHSANRETSPLLQTKIRSTAGTVFNEVTDLSHGGDAAIAITRAVPEHELARPRANSWWAIAVFLLWQAVDRTLGGNETRAAITAYLDEIGPAPAVTALTTGQDSIAPDSSMWDASKPVRDRVHDEMVNDLLGATIPDRRSFVHRYWLWAQRQPGLIEHVSATVQQRWNTEDGPDLIEITARFIAVNDRNFDGTDQLQPLDITMMTSILPRDIWPQNQIPTVPSPDIDPTDLSTESRRKFAAHQLFTAVHHSNEPA